ncbi:MAG: hypothetical protein R2795_14450 [Saprospiraceae bacterium]
MKANDLILLIILIAGTICINWGTITRDIFPSKPKSIANKGKKPRTNAGNPVGKMGREEVA